MKKGIEGFWWWKYKELDHFLDICDGVHHLWCFGKNSFAHASLSRSQNVSCPTMRSTSGQEGAKVLLPKENCGNREIVRLSWKFLFSLLCMVPMSSAGLRCPAELSSLFTKQCFTGAHNRLTAILKSKLFWIPRFLFYRSFQGNTLSDPKVFQGKNLSWTSEGIWIIFS